MSSPSPPSLTLLHTLLHPSSGSNRSWQSAPHPDSSTPLLATASADKSINIYSLKDFSLVSTISGGHKRSVRTVAWKDFGPQKKPARRTPVILGTGSFDANVGVWVWNDERRRSLLGSSPADPLRNNGTSSPDDAIETDMTREEEDSEEWHFSTLLTGPDSEIKSIAFSPPHYPANLLATSSRDKSVWVWEEVEPEEWETIAVLSEHTGDVKCVGWCTGAQRRRTNRRRVQKDGDVMMGEEGGHTNGKSTENESTEEDAHYDEDGILGARPLLASGSYDDTIRLWRDVEEEGDWICIAVIALHTGTVWDVMWEPYINYSLLDLSDITTTEEETTATNAFENDWQPRILSCSDDLSVRVWRRELNQVEKEKRRDQRQGGSSVATAPMGFASSRIPSVIRPMSAMENWVDDSTLPQVHLRSVYAVDWSKRTGLVVSCGGDGTIAVYREIPVPSSTRRHGGEGGDVVMNGTAPETASSAPTENGAPEENEPYNMHESKWEVIALMEAAHDEYEINHVCWAERRDQHRRFVGEEMIVSTGDEGDVRIWTLPEALIKEFEESG